MIFIPGNVPSLKNGKKIVQAGRYKKLVPSDAHKAYKKEYFIDYVQNAPNFLSKLETLKWPVLVVYFFKRATRHIFDYTNAVDTCQDLMVDAGWIPDDDSDHVKVYTAGYEYDKENPGVLIDVFQNIHDVQLPF